MNFKVGDRVSVKRYDDTNPPWAKLGDPAVVGMIRTKQVSQTGIMITVVGKHGGIATLDSGWIDEYKEPF